MDIRKDQAKRLFFSFSCTRQLLDTLDVLPRLPNSDVMKLLHIDNKYWRITKYIHLAAMLDRPHAIQKLLAAGADIEGRDATGATPLELASAVGAVSAVRMLVSIGAVVTPRALDLAATRATLEALDDDYPIL
jgi:ankyrin repeat protein